MLYYISLEFCPVEFHRKELMACNEVHHNCRIDFGSMARYSLKNRLEQIARAFLETRPVVYARRADLKKIDFEDLIPIVLQLTPKFWRVLVDLPAE